tara:strand:+ start:10028 stop:11485 length:1458 start_codon:yes stop_codon:yes gene_type:complete
LIGKAVHILLTDKIKEIATGEVYPVVMPQNANFNLNNLSKSNYPAVIYNVFTEYETSKDQLPNIIYSRLMIHVVSNSYKSTDTLSKKIRDVLDHYEDKSAKGLVNVPSYKDGGNLHNFINNVEISKIFYNEEEDDYLEKLDLYTRKIEYDVYYFDNVLKFSYDLKNSDNLTPTNPLCLNFDFTQNLLMRENTAGVPNYYSIPDNMDGADFIFNKLGKVKLIEDKGVNGKELQNYKEYIKSPDGFTLSPIYKDNPRCIEFVGSKSIEMENEGSSSLLSDKIPLPYGAMFIYVYRPLYTGGENYLSGDNGEAGDLAPMLLSHKKIGNDITIHFNPNGGSFSGSRVITLFTTSDPTQGINYWNADYHFLCVSLGGSKQYTGGTYNQSGWFEYFNSNYNPKLTTGQIIKNNSFTGNTDNMSDGTGNNFTFSRIGSGTSSAGFRMYELLLFIPNEKKTHGIDADAPPFQPTDIIYKKVKEYIYNKYTTLK